MGRWGGDFGNILEDYFWRGFRETGSMEDAHRLVALRDDMTEIRLHERDEERGK